MKYLKIIIIMLFLTLWLNADYGKSSIIIKGADKQPFSQDAMTNAITTITYEHHELHAGSHFIFSIDSTVGDADTLGLLIVTPNTTKWAHMVFSVQGALDTRFEIFETNTATPGSTRPVYNNDRNSKKVNTTLIKNTATVGGADGTKIFQSHFGIDSGLGANKVTGGGQDHAGQEWILKQNTQYMIAIISATDANVVSLKLSWYEHTNKN